MFYGNLSYLETILHFLVYFQLRLDSFRVCLNLAASDKRSIKVLVFYNRCHLYFFHQIFVVCINWSKSVN